MSAGDWAYALPEDGEKFPVIPPTDSNGQGSLLSTEDIVPWTAEWKDMPEYIQRDLMPRYSLTVNFACRSDLDEFSRAIGQRLTPNTRSIWFPPAEIGHIANKRYVNES